MDNSTQTPIRLIDYLEQLQAKGKLTFISTELPEILNVAEDTVKKYLQRLKRKKKIFQIRREFWVIVPPEYYARGVIPMTWFVDDLMKFLKKDYYIALHSAAQLLGAAHQQPMEYCLMIKKTPMRKIRNNKIALKFVVKKDWSDEDIIQKQTEAGYKCFFARTYSPRSYVLQLFCWWKKHDIDYYFRIDRINQTRKALPNCKTV
jgi:predicted transcriptional regulator of viral defense system